MLKKKIAPGIKTEPIRKLGNFKFQWTKTMYMYQDILSHIAFFYTLFKGYKCNKLYEITPKKRFLGSPRKQISNFTGTEKHRQNRHAYDSLGCIHTAKGRGEYFLTDEGGGC